MCNDIGQGLRPRHQALAWVFRSLEFWEGTRQLKLCNRPWLTRDMANSVVVSVQGTQIAQACTAPASLSALCVFQQVDMVGGSQNGKVNTKKHSSSQQNLIGTSTAAPSTKKPATGRPAEKAHIGGAVRKR